MAFVARNFHGFLQSRKTSKYFVLFRCLSSTLLNYSDHCHKTVRNHDYENYLCLLLLPEGSRAATFAVRAFNVELAQIQDAVSDRKLGQMRIQFWKDALDKIYTNSPTPLTPVALELAQAAKKYKLTRRWLERMISAREEKIISDVMFMNRRDVEEYAEKCNSSILYLTLECLGIRDIHADHAASHIGKAQGIATVIRATPYHAKRNMVYLPTDLLIKHNVSQEEVTRGSREQKMKDLTYELACQAHSHLDKVTAFVSKLPKSSLTAFLPSVTTRAYLRALERTDFDVFDSRLSHRNNWLPLSLWIHKFRGKI